MGIHIHTDASVIDGVGRGAYLIERKHKPNSSTITTHKHVFRTKPLDVGGNCTLAEQITLIQGIIHAIKLFPKEVNYDVYSDSSGALGLLNVKYKTFISGGADPLLYRLNNVISTEYEGERFNLVAHKVKAHKGVLESYEEKMNYVCDYICSVKGIG